MSAEENMAKVRAFYEEAVNKGNLAPIDELVGNPEIIHASGAGVGENTPTKVKAWVTELRAAFPDIHVTIEDLMAHGDRVVNRVTYRGTQSGELHDAVWGDIPPTGKRITWSAIAINRFQNGKSVEAWDLIDDASYWQQLGLIPPRK
jgi:predicted ester cyclase